MVLDLLNKYYTLSHTYTYLIISFKSPCKQYTISIYLEIMQIF